MTNYSMKAEGYNSVAASPSAVSRENWVTEDEWDRAKVNLGAPPAGLSSAEWTMRLYAEVRRLRQLRGDRK
jgi:hypothetical protein